MALTFKQQVKELDDSDFRSRIAVAAVKVALDVMAEKGDVKGHAERAAFSYRVLQNPISAASNLVFAVVNDKDCKSSGNNDPLDNDKALEKVLSSVWNAFSNYSPVLEVIGAGPVIGGAHDLSS